MANPRAHLTSSFWQYVENLRQLRQVCKESASHVLHGRHKKIVTKLLACKPHFESSRKSMQGACRVHALQSTHSSPRTPVHAFQSTHSSPRIRIHTLAFPHLRLLNRVAADSNISHATLCSSSNRRILPKMRFRHARSRLCCAMVLRRIKVP